MVNSVFDAANAAAARKARTESERRYWRVAGEPGSL
jgi:hypothetical protein